MWSRLNVLFFISNLPIPPLHDRPSLALLGFVLFSAVSAPILARPNTMLDRVNSAPGHIASAALVNNV